jgi:hypothetical protein
MQVQRVVVYLQSTSTKLRVATRELVDPPLRLGRPISGCTVNASIPLSRLPAREAQP